MLPTVARQHIVAATSATLSFQGVDSDGEPADPGTVTVTVAPSNPNGSAIATAAATTGTGTDPRTFALTPAQTETIDQIAATWTAAGVVLATTRHDIVGAPLITLADFRMREPRQSTVTLADFLRARFETDALFRRVTGRSFVPRFQTETISYPRTSVLAHPDVRSIVWAVDEDGTAINLSDAEVYASGAFDFGIAAVCGKVTVGYSHGMDAPPDDVVGAAAKLIRAKLTDGTSMIPQRADSFETQLGAATFTPRAGYGRAWTAIDEVDEVLNAYRRAPVA